MAASSRFIIRESSDYQIELSDTVPWQNNSSEWLPLGARIGWRCYCAVYGHSARAVDKIIESLGPSPSLFVAEQLEAICFSAGFVTEKQVFGRVALVVEVWTSRARAMPEDIEAAANALGAAVRVLSAKLNLEYTDLRKEQEFIEVWLAPFIVSRLQPTFANATLASYSKSRRAEDLPTVRVDGDRLKLGPEHDGAIQAVVRYLQAMTDEVRRDSFLSARPYSLAKFAPLGLAILLVLSWALPLTTLSVTAFAISFIAIAGAALFPAYVAGWDIVFRQPSTIATTTFFGIGMFGVLYAMCALAGDEQLGHVTSLGYPFLVATSLGVAGGVLGENPTGAARVIAHIELLLFLSGIAGLIAMLLRIDRHTRKQREEVERRED